MAGGTICPTQPFSVHISITHPNFLSSVLGSFKVVVELEVVYMRGADQGQIQIYVKRGSK